MQKINNFLELELFQIGEFKLQVLTFISILLIFLFTKLILIVAKKALYRRKNRKLDVGASYALYQII